MANWEFNNELSVRKMVYILFVISTILILILISLIDPVSTSKVQFYWWLSMAGLIVFGIDATWSKLKGGSILSVCTWESEDFFGPVTKSREWTLIIVSLAIGAFVFFNVIATGYSIVGTPASLLQTVPLGKTGEVLITICAAVSENMIFFYFLMPTVFSIIYYITKNGPVAFLLGVVLISPALFSLYHFGAYGTSQLTATISTWVFGMICCLFTFIFRMPIFTDVFHISNNLAAALAGVLKVGLSIVR